MSMEINEMQEMNERAKKALEYHKKGYNCSQAVACSFCEEFGVDEETMFRIAEGFGFGMGMMDICGAVTGMFMVMGLVLSSFLSSLMPFIPVRSTSHSDAFLIS